MVARRPAGRSGATQIKRPAWKNPATVLITGAARGIGAALARSYAGAGRTLILHDREPASLVVPCEECRRRGARVETVAFDLRDAHAAVERLRALSEREAIDLAIVNAGVMRLIGDGEQVESFEVAREILGVNLDGALATVAGILPAMRRRRSGQIALMSSLAALHGLPEIPLYCATKSGLKAYGEALRLWLAPQGIAVSVVLPGFVRTSMIESVAGRKPGITSPDRAASLIRRGLEHNRARIEFPRWLACGLYGLSVLPPSLSERILRAPSFGGRTRR